MPAARSTTASSTRCSPLRCRTSTSSCRTSAREQAACSTSFARDGRALEAGRRIVVALHYEIRPACALEQSADLAAGEPRVLSRLQVSEVFDGGEGAQRRELRILVD